MLLREGQTPCGVGTINWKHPMARGSQATDSPSSVSHLFAPIIVLDLDKAARSTGEQQGKQ